MKNRNIIGPFSTTSIPALMLTFIFVIRATTTPGAQSVSASSGVADFSPTPTESSLPVSNQAAVDYLIAHFQLPEDYIASKFKDHQLVFGKVCMAPNRICFFCRN